MLFHIKLFLLGKLNKTNEDRIIGVNIYWKRYPFHYIYIHISFDLDRQIYYCKI